jgi:hypothetical protein
MADWRIHISVLRGKRRSTARTPVPPHGVPLHNHDYHAIGAVQAVSVITPEWTPISTADPKRTKSHS